MNNDILIIAKFMPDWNRRGSRKWGQRKWGQSPLFIEQKVGIVPIFSTRTKSGDCPHFLDRPNPTLGGF